MMSVREILLVAVLVVVVSCQSLPPGSSLLDPKDGDSWDRYLQDNDNNSNGSLRVGKRNIYQRCGTRNLCQANLQCTRAGPARGRICLPMTCLEEAFTTDQNLESYAQDILEQAGLSSTRSDLFNETTMRNHGGQLLPLARQYLLNDGVAAALEQAMHDVPVDLNRIQARVSECTRPHLDATTLTTQDEVYCGLQLEASLGGKFIAQLILDRNQKASYHLCLGAGPDVDLHVAFVVGAVLSANSIDNINQVSVMVDADITASTGVGWAVGFTYPVFKTRLELTIGVGLGLGAGGYGCLVV